MHSEVRQERFDLRFGGEEVCARPHTVEADEPDDPVHIGALGMNRVVMETKHFTDFIEEFWLLTSVASGISGLHLGALRLLITGTGQNCPKTLLISHYQGKMAS